MFPPFDYFTYRRIRDSKRQQRATRFASLPKSYRAPFTDFDKETITQPIQDLVRDVQDDPDRRHDILHTYGKVAAYAQDKTNCITELLLPEAEGWDINTQGPLAGVPVSLKDSIVVKGFDTSVGYTSYCGKGEKDDGPVVRLLKAAGAVPYAKTALPTTLLSFESATGLWGTCRNPHVPEYSPGGSSGGESALIALGGRIGIGSDVAGSVRVPAAWSGIYSLRCSTGRWPKAGFRTTMPGQEGVPSVYSPMARTLNDLTYFTRSIIEMEPWKYDYTVHPIPWRADQQEQREKKLRIGVMYSDDVVPPTPAISRALHTTVSALTTAGHEIHPVIPPESATPFDGLALGSQLINADGLTTVHSFIHTFEPTDPGAAQLWRVASLPRAIRYLYYLYIRYIKRDKKWATLIHSFGPKSAAENWKLVTQREAYRVTWNDWWSEASQDYDFILCPVNATPALPHGAMADAVSSCGYTFLWNVLDYAAGVIPVSHVHAVKDALSAPYQTALKDLGANHAIARGAWKHYDAVKMADLPTAVQIVGRRWEEEKVLGYMGVVERALEAYEDAEMGEGGKYVLLEVD